MTAKHFLPVHPDDVMLFAEMSRVIWSIAKEYKLPVKSVEGYPNPEYRQSPLGDCSYDGVIRLVMRGMENGEWDPNPRREDDIWGTVAHELAHLRHFNHGLNFQEFEQEMKTAVANRRVDHRQKIIDRLVKMQASRDSEAKIGNEQAAEAFAAAINKMLIEYELNPSELDYARTSDRDPIIEKMVDPAKFRYQGENDSKPRADYGKKTRVAWQEALAGVVARAHLCAFLVHRESNKIWFVGTEAHATVAEYVFTVLLTNADYMAEKEHYHYALKCKREGRAKDARGYKGSWLMAFVDRVEQRLQQARKEAVQTETSHVPGGESQALMRLNGAMIKVQQYMDHKFHGRGSRYAKSLMARGGHHADGARDGKAAADRMPIGRKGISGNKPKGYLEGDQS